MPAKPRPLFDFRDVPAALGLLTRLPVKVNTDHAMTRGAAAAWAFPLVGLVVGGLTGLVGAGALGLGLTPAIAAGLALAAQVLVTGAMHEDGLADCADGFWGGWTRPRRLEIMKDSRIGAYGVLALILGIGLKWVALEAIFARGPSVWPWLICAAVLSRAAMVWIMATLPHARPAGLAAQVGRPRRAIAWVALGGAAGLCLLFAGLAGALAVGIAWGTGGLIGRLARARIGGQTGDVLGGVQGCTEIAILLCAVALT